MASSRRKTVMLTIRVDDVLKSEIEEAATARGMTVSAFMLEAARTAAAKPVKLPKPTGHGSIPRWFAAACESAKSGGDFGYEVVGQTFAKSLDGEVPYSESFETWDVALAELAQHCAAGDEAAILAWFDDRFSRSMNLIPNRRRGLFARGVVAAWQDGDRDWSQH